MSIYRPTFSELQIECRSFHRAKCALITRKKSELTECSSWMILLSYFIRFIYWQQVISLALAINIYVRYDPSTQYVCVKWNEIWILKIHTHRDRQTFGANTRYLCWDLSIEPSSTFTHSLSHSFSVSYPYLINTFVYAMYAFPSYNNSKQYICDTESAYIQNGTHGTSYSDRA